MFDGEQIVVLEEKWSPERRDKVQDVLTEKLVSCGLFQASAAK